MIAPDPMAIAIDELERQLAKCRKELAAAKATQEYLTQQLRQAREELKTHLPTEKEQYIQAYGVKWRRRED